jgi:hypothetical protein
VDHSAFDRLLRAHVRGGLVDYDAFKNSAEFRQYLATLAATDPSRLGRAEQLTLWINAYNAYTIELINKHNERASIRNINKSFGGLVKAYGPWKEKLATVGGRAYGLDEIEQDILRKRFREPRIHFALVCAAMGCPPLRSEAYAAPRLDAQLGRPGAPVPAPLAGEEPRGRGRPHRVPEPDLRRVPRLHQRLRRQRGGGGPVHRALLPGRARAPAARERQLQGREDPYDWKLNKQG